MKLGLPLAIAGTLAFFLSPALGLAAAAEPANAQASHAIKKEVEIVSGGAAKSDLHLSWLRDFEHFKRDHPAITHDFNRDPMLVCSREFRTDHPEWASFLNEHPAIGADIEANPGNYVAIPPRLAYATEHK
jgi:hypothetical protein